MQRRLLLIMAWGLAMSLYAQHPEYLHLWQKDGACVSFMLNEHPRSHVRGEEMILETNTQTIAYKLTDIQKLTFGDDGTGIQEIDTDSQLGIAIGNDIKITGAMPNTPVVIFGINGSVMGRYKTDGLGSLSIPYSQFSAGVVLINVGGVTYKMMTR